MVAIYLAVDLHDQDGFAPVRIERALSGALPDAIHAVYPSYPPPGPTIYDSMVDDRSSGSGR